MKRTADVAILGASRVNDNGVPVVQASCPLTNEQDDVESFGEIDSMQGLGLTSVPWPADENGHAEGVVLTGVGNREGVIIGARDTRTAKVVGKAKPGDTILHSTGPQMAAQVQLKEERRQAVVVTKDSGGDGMMFNMDGTADKIQIMAFGCSIEMAKGGDITITNGDASILLQGGNIFLLGTVVLGGQMANPAQKLMLGPPSGSPGGVASAPLMPAMGVSIGL